MFHFYHRLCQTKLKFRNINCLHPKFRCFLRLVTHQKSFLFFSENSQYAENFYRITNLDKKKMSEMLNLYKTEEYTF